VKRIFLQHSKEGGMPPSCRSRLSYHQSQKVENCLQKGQNQALKNQRNIKNQNQNIKKIKKRKKSDQSQVNKKKKNLRNLIF
jgi:hypothetical protein